MNGLRDIRQMVGSTDQVVDAKKIQRPNFCLQ